MDSKKNILSTGLSLISDYASDNSNSSEEETIDTSRCVKERLPLPESFLKQDQENMNCYYDNPHLHGGRIRSFPHERGNWATYAYTPFLDAFNSNYKYFVNETIKKISPIVKLEPVAEPHISLTRTVVLYEHWIESFVKSIRLQLKDVQRFDVKLDKLSVYTNGEENRTFIGIDVGCIGYENLLGLSNGLNDCLKEYKLPSFYANPSFHLSFVWCLGNKKEVLENALPELTEFLTEFNSTHPDVFRFPIRNYHCKVGNRLYNFDLKNL